MGRNEVTPLGAEGLQDERCKSHHLRYYPPKIRPNMRAHKSHKITPIEFLYYLDSSCEYMRQDSLFIGKSALTGKKGKGKRVI